MFVPPGLATELLLTLDHKGLTSIIYNINKHNYLTTNALLLVSTLIERCG